MQLQLLTLALLWAHESGDCVTRGGKPAQSIGGAEGWLLLLCVLHVRGLHRLVLHILKL